MIQYCMVRSTACFFIKRFLNHRVASLHSYTLENIHCYGLLTTRCPSIITNVKCINPHEVPDGNKSFIRVESNSKDFDLKCFSIDYEKGESKILIKLKKEYESIVPDNASIFIEVPHIYDLDIESLQVNVEETEGEKMRIISEKDCSLGKIKSLKTEIVSSGSITCKSLLGDGHINAIGHLRIKKLQSKGIDINSGSIDISAVYCPNFKCRTTGGDISINNMHGRGEISSELGSVTIGSMAGDVNVNTKSGRIDITVEQCETIDLTSDDGDIDVGLGDTVSAFIESKGKHIDVPEDLLVDGMKEHSSSGFQNFEGRYGDGKNSIKVSTGNGNISFSKKNWFSKFQLDD